MPGGWHPIQYVLTPMAWFLGTWLGAVLIGHGVRYSYPTLRGLYDPPMIEMTPNSGNEAFVTVRCAQGSVRLTADGQIVAADGQSIPATQPFRCELSLRGVDRELEANLQNGEWLIIPIADSVTWAIGSSRLRVFTGPRRSEAIMDSGVTVEVSLRTIPTLKTPIRKRYRVSRDRFHISVTEL